jgi:hypothetical protein
VIHIQGFIALAFLVGLLIWASSIRFQVREFRKELDDNPCPETWEDSDGGA